MSADRKAYADVKWLLSQEQWQSYESLIANEISRIIDVIKSTNPDVDLYELRTRLQQTQRVLDMPHDFVRSIEESVKENSL